MDLHEPVQQLLVLVCFGYLLAFVVGCTPERSRRLFRTFRVLERLTFAAPRVLTDFEFPTSLPSFDFDIFSTGPATPFFSNPFSPSAVAVSPPYDPHPYQQPLSQPAETYLDDGQPAPPSHLFDDSESSLFSTFLNTIDVDQNFLFNPVLPPGMPSPPSAIFPTFEELQERDRLGREVNAMNLGLGTSHHHAPMSQDWGLPKEEEADGGFEWGRREGGRRWRAREDERIVGSGKKIKTEDEHHFTGHQGGEHFDRVDDVEMASSYTETSQTTAKPLQRNSRASTSAATRRKACTTPIPRQTKATIAKPKPPKAAPHQASPPPPSQLEEPPSDDQDTRGRSSSPESGSNSKKVPLTASQKRSNHILSEQRRRNAIRSGFKDLFELVSNGETLSGIVVAPPPEPEVDAGGKKKKTKGSGRGRGRKGEVGAGASKSVVLEKAGDYIRWLDRGNHGLEAEVERVEGILRAAKI